MNKITTYLYNDLWANHSKDMNYTKFAACSVLREKSHAPKETPCSFDSFWREVLEQAKLTYGEINQNISCFGEGGVWVEWDGVQRNILGW